MARVCPPRFILAVFVFLLAAAALPGSVLDVRPAAAQGADEDALLEEAARRTGLSKDEIRQRAAAAAGQQNAEAQEPSEPGRTTLEGIDDGLARTGRWRDTSEAVVLPFDGLLAAAAAEEAAEVAPGDSLASFGAGFFRPGSGLFQPPSFGPVSDGYRLGVGDEIVIHAWGEVDFQLTRIVDRDGSVILPRSGKVVCAGRTLETAAAAIRRSLAESHASIDAEGGGEGGTTVEVTLGQLRPIRVFVVGAVERPGACELNSASSVMTALTAVGGPTVDGSLRSVRLVRGGEIVATLDLYDYLLGGSRAGDAHLQEGDTVFVPDVGPRVRIAGEVRRPAWYELLPGETLTDAIGFAGGFTASAAADVIHIERILPAAERREGSPDQVTRDVAYDAVRMRPADGAPFELLDGDRIEIAAAGARLENWVEIRGAVKQPGRYELAPGLTAADLIAAAGGTWSDALVERAVIDRTNELEELSSIAFRLDAAQPPELTARDVVHVFTRRETEQRPQVYIDGEVLRPHEEDFRAGMTLRDLILKAGGLKQSADRVRVEIARLRRDAVLSRDLGERPQQTVDVLEISLGADFLSAPDGVPLEAWDRVFVRKLPWWQMQETVTVTGEVFYPGAFSLLRQDERLSSLIRRAGGLKPDAYLPGARVVRAQDAVGNIAVDMARALAAPGSEFDIILQAGDQVVIPDEMFTVKVVGEVGFPTSLVFQDGKNINWYVDRAGGYLEKADKGKTRVVYPNGMSLPNKRGSRVIAGSTIVVPVEPPREGEGKLAMLRDISSIIASVATVWLVIDRTN